MNFINKKLWVIVLLSTTLMACSSTNDKKDEDNKIADRPEIKQQFEPKVLWHDSVGGVDSYFSRLKPAITSKLVYSASRDGDVYAYDIKNGDEKWHTDIGDIEFHTGFFEHRQSAMLSGGVTVGVNNVFIGTEDGGLFALNAQTGKLVWQSQVEGEIIAVPAVDLGIVVVNTVSGVVKAFNANTGKTIWKIEQEVPPLSLRGTAAPVIASGGVLIGSAAGELSVYMLATGQEGWNTQIGEPTGATELDRVIDVDSAPVVFGDKIYAISSRGNLTSIDLRSGRIIWKRQYSSYRSITIDGNNIYITDVKGHVYSLDRIDGLEQWSQLSLTNRNVTGPVVVGNYVVVGDYEGYLYWLDRNTGDIVAQHYVDGSGIYATPVVADNLIYAQSRDGDLEVIETP